MCPTISQCTKTPSVFSKPRNSLSFYSFCSGFVLGILNIHMLIDFGNPSSQIHIQLLSISKLNCKFSFILYSFSVFKFLHLQIIPCSPLIKTISPKWINEISLNINVEIKHAYMDEMVIFIPRGGRYDFSYGEKQFHFSL